MGCFRQASGQKLNGRLVQGGKGFVDERQRSACDQRGRELGYPTANLPVPADLAVPADGVYAGWLTATDGVRLPAAISVGSNPTFNGVDRRVESYVLDRTDLELYGEEIVVDFVDRLRGQVKFDGIEGLIAQMDQDIDQCRRVLGVAE